MINMAQTSNDQSTKTLQLNDSKWLELFILIFVSYSYTISAGYSYFVGVLNYAFRFNY